MCGMMERAAKILEPAFVSSPAFAACGEPAGAAELWPDANFLPILRLTLRLIHLPRSSGVWGLILSADCTD